MHPVDDSFSIVLVGDWSKTYTEPEWIAENIFCDSEMELGIEMHGSGILPAYKKGEVIVKPRQTRVVFSVSNIGEATLKLLEKYVTNFLKKSFTPSFAAYGFNIDYNDNEDLHLASVFDALSDTTSILDLGYQVDTSEIKRQLSRDSYIINMDCRLEHNKTTIHFNEHHAVKDCSQVSIDYSIIQGFIEETHRIVNGLGYTTEVDTQ